MNYFVKKFSNLMNGIRVQLRICVILYAKRKLDAYRYMLVRHSLPLSDDPSGRPCCFYLVLDRFWCKNNAKIKLKIFENSWKSFLGPEKPTIFSMKTMLSKKMFAKWNVHLSKLYRLTPHSSWSDVPKQSYKAQKLRTWRTKGPKDGPVCFT